jgi:hypothetical protein
MINPGHIEGKRIVRVDTNPFPDGRGGTAHEPRITLDDGSVLFFMVEETDTAEPYGVDIKRVLPTKTGKNRGRGKRKS